MVEIEDHHQLIEILNQDKITIVDFHADWCGPCQVLNNNLNELIGKYNDEIGVAKVNVDKHQSLLSSLSIKSIPSLVFFKEGQIIGDITGVKSVIEIQQKIDTLKT